MFATLGMSTLGTCAPYAGSYDMGIIFLAVTIGNPGSYDMGIIFLVVTIGNVCWKWDLGSIGATAKGFWANEGLGTTAGLGVVIEVGLGLGLIGSEKRGMTGSGIGTDILGRVAIAWILFVVLLRTIRKKRQLCLFIIAMMSTTDCQRKSLVIFVGTVSLLERMSRC